MTIGDPPLGDLAGVAAKIELAGIEEHLHWMNRMACNFHGS
jgi:hypothetical protein